MKVHSFFHDECQVVIEVTDELLEKCGKAYGTDFGVNTDSIPCVVW